MGIANSGAGGGDREDVDSDDPHVHVVVRGLFGIEPALHEGRLDICPALPSAWREASIRTPDVSYAYRRRGNRATFRIRTPQAVVKRVRGNLTAAGSGDAGGKRVDALRCRLGPPAAAAGAGQGSRRSWSIGTPPPAPAVVPEVAGAARCCSICRAACNVTARSLRPRRFTFDYADGPQPLASWWGNPPLVHAARAADGRGAQRRACSSPPVGRGPGPGRRRRTCWPWRVGSPIRCRAAPSSRSECAAGRCGSSCRATFIR